MVQHSKIDTALRSCACCHDTLTPEDFPGADAFTHLDALAKRYGTVPCTGCADHHAACTVCGKAVTETEIRTSHDGHVECDDCEGRTDAEIAAELRHQRQERTA
jgi:hypothetical protein